jgi:hypothetical protein
MIRELTWRLVARVVTISFAADWLIARAARTPYYDITGPDGSLYMGRWWLFNPYGKADGEQTAARWPWLPSIRVHHIVRPDSDRHMHDHPWNARTIILRGEYTEERRISAVPKGTWWFPLYEGDLLRAGFTRQRGYTGRLLFGEYHRIREVSPGGVWTVFFTWNKRGTWGFLVDGAKVPWRKYLGLEKT